MLFNDALKEYEYHCLARGYTKKTMINKRQEYKHLYIFLSEKRGISELESITFHDLRAYIRFRQQSGIEPSSIRSMAKQAIAFFNWCIAEEYLITNPMDKVALPKLPKKTFIGFTLKEVLSMIQAFNDKEYLEVRNKAIIAMMADCGLRSMEIRGLQTENVKETTILVQGKGNKERVVFISPALKKILIKYERLKKSYFADKPIGGNNYFLSYQGYGLSHPAIHNLIKEAGRRAGIENVHPHKFRHFYAVESLNQGNDVYSLSRLLGHSEISTTQRYLQSLSSEQLSNKALSSSPLMNRRTN